MAKYILFDTETTGIKEEDRIIQIGAMIVNSKGKVEVFDELCKAILPITLESMAVHGITPELIEKKGKFTETNFYKILQTLNTQDNYLIAHNITFDLEMLKKEGFQPNIKMIDTLRCIKHLLPESKSHSLQYLRYSLELYKLEKQEAEKYNIIIKPHDAIGDVLIMKLLLSKLVKLIKESYPNINPMVKLEQITQTPVFVKTFKFGKYKGRNIEEVYFEQPQYLKWMKNTLDLDPDMIYTIDKILKI
jgi:DNA polymerase III epsilon subunit-like protein